MPQNKCWWTGILEEKYFWQLWKTLTCLLKRSACGAKAMGSASLTNFMTSSIDQVEGSLLLVLGESRSVEWRSGPVVELAATSKSAR